jgi:hypothetical protein
MSPSPESDLGSVGFAGGGASVEPVPRQLQGVTRQSQTPAVFLADLCQVHVTKAQVLVDFSLRISKVFAWAVQVMTWGARM